MEVDEISPMIKDIDEQIRNLKKQKRRKKKPVLAPGVGLGYVNPGARENIIDSMIDELRCRRFDLVRLLEEKTAENERKEEKRNVIC